jgi:hypothetical protein
MYVRRTDFKERSGSLFLLVVISFLDTIMRARTMSKVEVMEEKERYAEEEEMKD